MVPTSITQETYSRLKEITGCLKVFVFHTMLWRKPHIGKRDWCQTQNCEKQLVKKTLITKKLSAKKLKLLQWFIFLWCFIVVLWPGCIKYEICIGGMVRPTSMNIFMYILGAPFTVHSKYPEVYPCIKLHYINRCRYILEITDKISHVGAGYISHAIQNDQRCSPICSSA